MIFEEPLLMKSEKEILQDLRFSVETDCVLKIKLKHRANPVITAVENLDNENIVLRATCLYGYPLEKRNITLSEIESVTRYNTKFNHPVFKKLRFIKNNISHIRQNFESFSAETSGLANT